MHKEPEKGVKAYATCENKGLTKDAAEWQAIGYRLLPTLHEQTIFVGRKRHDLFVAGHVGLVDDAAKLKREFAQKS